MIVTISGDDSYALKERRQELVNEFVSKHGDINIERIDGDEADSEQILDAIQNVPLLGSKMVIISSAASQKNLLEQLEEISRNIPNTTEVLLIDSKFDKRAKYYKLLQKYSDFQDFSSSKTADINDWIVKTAQTKHGQISRADASYLVQQVGTNKTWLANEIEKLIIFDSDITKETIDLLCEPTPASTVFQLIDAMFIGNHEKAIKLYKDQRRQRVEPLAILAMITWQLHVLALLKTAGNKTVSDIARESKVSPFVLNKSKTIAAKLPMTQLKKMIKRTLNLDVRLKTESIDADQAMQHLLLTMA